ncbi:MAG: YCF48-related protein [Candidatus Cloacimonadales bacterium]
MSRRILVIFIILSFLVSGLAAWELNRQTDFPVHLYDIEQVGQQIWVGGMNGAFAKSVDNGETFSFVESPAFNAATNYYKDVNGIAFADENNGIVASENGLAFITSDGESWQTIDFIADYFGNDHLEDVAYLADGKIWAVGSAGKVAYSEDFGANWQAQESGVSATIYAVEMAADGTGYLVGNNGSSDLTWVQKTIDFGANWFDSGASFMDDPHLYEVVSNNGKVIVSGGDGFIAVSEDGAATFQQINGTGASHHLRNIAMNGDLGFAVGWYGELLKTTDNWETASFVENNFSSYFDGVAFTEDGQVIICGWYGTVAKSDYAAAAWVEKTVPAYYLYGGDILDEENWFLAGGRSTLIRTEDAGASYQRLDVTTEAEDFFAVCFFDTEVGVVASEEDGRLYRTTDAGSSWEEINLAMGEISHILKIDDQEAYVMGAGNIHYTEDQGANWQSLGASYALYGATAKENGDIFFVGEGGEVVIKSADDEWSSFNLGTENLYGVAFSSDQVGVITTIEGNIYYTANGGTDLADWQQADYDGTDQLLGISTNLDGDFVAVGYANNAGNQGVENAIIISQDNGVSWEMIDIEQPAFIPTRLKNILSYQGRLVAYGGYQLVYTHYDASYGTLSGTVNLSGGEGNVEEVALTIADEVYYPAADGSFELELETGVYQLSAELAGYDPVVIEEIEILADQITNLDLELFATIYYGSLVGTVSLEGGDAEVSAVNIEIAGQNISPDELGDFSLELEVGSYQLIASLEGYVTETVTDILIETEQITEISIELTLAQSSSQDLTLVTELIGNYPNPFTSTKSQRAASTTIRFSLQTAEIAELTIYNARGQIVQKEFLACEAGKHSYGWDAAEQSSGIYFYRLQTSDYNQVKKMILLK